MIRQSWGLCSTPLKVSGHTCRVSVQADLSWVHHTQLQKSFMSSVWGVHLSLPLTHLLNCYLYLHKLMDISSLSRSDHWELCVGAAGWRTQDQRYTPVPSLEAFSLGSWDPSVKLCCLHLCTFPYLLALQEISGLLARFLGTPGSFHWKNRHGIQDLGTDVLAATGILLLLGPLMDRAKKYMIHACMYACMSVCMYVY